MHLGLEMSNFGKVKVFNSVIHNLLTCSIDEDNRAEKGLLLAQDWEEQ